MTCPKCSSSMEKINYESIVIDRCTHCQGIWFDMLEHEDLKKIKGSEVIDIGDHELGEKYNHLDKINCPLCSIPMASMVNIFQPNIKYESCTKCFGIFFDAGEFTDYKNHSIFDFFKELLIKSKK